MHLLDHVTGAGKTPTGQEDFFNSLFQISDIKDHWKRNKTLIMGEVAIRPVTTDQVPVICQWLLQSEIKNTFIDFIPKSPAELTSYLFDNDDRIYFAKYYKDEFVGIIGGEKIDDAHRSLEMKKFIGHPDFTGKGIGKKATFLFLYYAFVILDLNKVYIHSIDTNIRNINLNSKFGFELEGIFFQEIKKGHKFFDVVRMGLLKKQWLTIFSV
jgi:RimJ/RimL family protein N-acetyltransferase